MKKIITILILLFVTTINAQVKNRIERNDKNASTKVYRVQNQDLEMEEAINLAKLTFHEFEAALKSENTNFANFLIKKGFESDKGEEYLWISNIMINKNKNNYVGIVANEPLYTKVVKAGDIVEISNEDVGDWMYLENNVVKGGYTLKLLRSRMSEKERNQFDRESHLKFN